MQIALSKAGHIRPSLPTQNRLLPKPGRAANLVGQNLRGRLCQVQEFRESGRFRSPVLELPALVPSGRQTLRGLVGRSSSHFSISLPKMECVSFAPPICLCPLSPHRSPETLFEIQALGAREEKAMQSLQVRPAALAKAFNGSTWNNSPLSKY